MSYSAWMDVATEHIVVRRDADDVQIHLPVRRLVLMAWCGADLMRLGAKLLDVEERRLGVALGPGSRVYYDQE